MMAISSVRTILSSFFHPVEATRQNLTHIFTGTQTQSLDRLIESLKSYKDHPGEEGYEVLLQALSHLKMNPKLWGIASVDPTIIDQLIEHIAVEGFNPSLFDQALKPLLKLQTESMGIIPQLFKLIDQKKENLIKEAHQFIASQFAYSPEFKFLVENCKIENKQDLISWLKDKNSESIKKLIFSKTILSDEEQIKWKKIDTFFQSLFQSPDDLESKDFQEIHLILSDYYTQKTGSVEKIKSVFYQMLSAVEEKKISLSQQLTDLLGNVHEDAIFLQKTLKELPRAEDSETQLSFLEKSLLRFNGITAKKIKEAIVGDLEITDDKKLAYKTLHQHLQAIHRHLKDGTFLTITELEPVIKLIDQLIEEKQGLIAKSLAKITSLIEKECATCPPLLKNTFISLVLYKKINSEEEKYRLYENLNLFINQYRTSLNQESEELFILIKEGIFDPIHEISAHEIVRAQEIVLQIMKPLQGSTFQAADLLKRELADKRTGLVATTIHTALQTTKDEVLRSASLPIQTIYEKALSYQRKSCSFEELNEVIARWKTNEQVNHRQQVFLQSLNPENFAEWFDRLKKMKEHSQGFLPHLTDHLQELLHDSIAPYFSILSILKPSEETATNPSRSPLQQILFLIENSSLKMVQYGIGFSLKKAHEWIQKTQIENKSPEEAAKINSIFSEILRQFEITDFTKKEQRESLVSLIKTTLSPYQIMIDNVIAMPNFHQATNHKEIQELKEILKQDDPSINIRSWMDKIGPGQLKRKLFDENDYHSADEETIAQVIGIIEEISQGNLANLVQLQSLFRSIFIQEEDLSIDYSIKVSAELNKKVTEPNQELSQEAIAQQKSLLVQNSSFFLIHILTKKILSIDDNLQAELNAAEHEISKSSKEDEQSLYTKKLADINYYEKEQNLFTHLMENLSADPLARKAEFFKSLNHMIDGSDANFLTKKMMITFLPIFFELSSKIAEHLISKVIEIIGQISLSAATDGNQRLNTDYIRKITGYLNKIDRIYRSMDPKSSDCDLSVLDLFLRQMKEKIKVNKEDCEIEEIFSLINKQIIQTFIPNSHHVSTKLNWMSAIFLNEMKHSSSAGATFLKSLFCLPCFLLTSLLNHLIVIPVESISGFVGRNLLIKTMNFTHISQSVVNIIFEKLNKTTGLYHSIKPSIVNLMENISIDELFQPSEDEDKTAILDNQNSAKRDIGEMYESLKVAVGWIKEATSKQRLIEILSSSGAIKIGINQFETKFFSETVAGGLLKLFHKVTQPKFIEQKIIGKSLIVANDLIKKIDQVFTLEKRRDQKAANQLCDNKFQQLSFDMMSSIFDKILNHATADLGPKEQTSIDEFIRSTKTNFQELSIADDLNGLSLKEKIKNLEKLKSSLFRKTAHFQQLKFNLRTSIRDASFQNIQQKVNPLEKLIEELAISINRELDQSKKLYETSLFSDSFIALTQQKDEIIQFIQASERSIDDEEMPDYDQFAQLTGLFRSSLDLIKPYKIGEKQISFLSEKTRAEITKLFKFQKDYEKNWVTLINRYQLNIIKNLGNNIDLDSPVFNSRIDLLLGKIEEFQFINNFPKLTQLAKNIKNKPNRAFALEQFKEKISTEQKTLTLRSLEFAYTQDVDNEVFESKGNIESLLGRIRSTAERIKPIEYLNFDLIQHTKIVAPCKKFVLKEIKKEFDKYKDFLNCNEIVETFFYNCVLTALV